MLKSNLIKALFVEILVFPVSLIGNYSFLFRMRHLTTGVHGLLIIELLQSDIYFVSIIYIS